MTYLTVEVFNFAANILWPRCSASEILEGKSDLGLTRGGSPFTARNMGRFDYYSGSRWAPYVPVAERRRLAAKEAAAITKKTGVPLTPVRFEGRKMVTTFWGQAWNQNLERYQDYGNRLPRGRQYLGNGSVIDLKIKSGQITALVQGSSLYKIKIEVEPFWPSLWRDLKQRCAGKIDSLIGLLQGQLPPAVMEIVTAPTSGLFPSPASIALSCTCPDGARVCKHVAAAIYGVGVRLDTQPDLLFTLRGVDHKELITEAAQAVAHQTASGITEDGLEGDLGSLFGIELDAAPAAVVANTRATAKAATKKVAKKVVKASPAKKVAKKVAAKKPVKAVKKAAKR